MAFQIKVECPICKRSYFKEWPNDPKGKSTSGTCARCFAAHEHKHKEGLSEQLLTDQIRRELEAGVVWQGEEELKEPFGSEDIAYYEQLLSRVRGEQEGGGDERR